MQTRSMRTEGAIQQVQPAAMTWVKYMLPSVITSLSLRGRSALNFTPLFAFIYGACLDTVTNVSKLIHKIEKRSTTCV
jgi:hypothetical protein